MQGPQEPEAFTGTVPTYSPRWLERLRPLCQDEGANIVSSVMCLVGGVPMHSDQERCAARLAAERDGGAGTVMDDGGAAVVRFAVAR